MKIKNCAYCGSSLIPTVDKENMCPNHGVIAENQDWIWTLESKKEKKKKDD